MDSQQSPYVVIGLAAIAELFGVTTRTIQNWRRKEGFPIARLPSGTWATTLDLLNVWLAGRHDIDPYARDGKTPAHFQDGAVARKVAGEMTEVELQAILASAERAPKEGA